MSKTDFVMSTALCCELLAAIPVQIFTHIRERDKAHTKTIDYIMETNSEILSNYHHWYPVINWNPVTTFFLDPEPSTIWHIPSSLPLKLFLSEVKYYGPHSGSSVKNPAHPPPKPPLV